MNNSLMSENTSYFITVLVTKDERQDVYTQEVFIVPGDPPEVQIRYVKRKQPGRHLKFNCAFNFPCDQNMLEYIAITSSVRLTFHLTFSLAIFSKEDNIKSQHWDCALNNSNVAD